MMSFALAVGAKLHMSALCAAITSSINTLTIAALVESCIRGQRKPDLRSAYLETTE